MRLAYVCADRGVPVFGRKGCSIHVQEVVRALASEGAEIDLFARRLGGAAPPGFPARVHALDDADDAVDAALARGGPFDVVYERYSLAGGDGMAHARRLGIAGLLEVNAPLIEEHLAHRGALDRPAAECASARAFDAARRLIAVSDNMADYLRKRGVAADRIDVIPNGVDLDRFGPHVRPRLAPAPGRFTIGFVGTLKPWHGLGTLVEAFAGLRARDTGARLLMVGDGPERPALEARLAALGAAGDVVWTGAVDPADVPGWLASMDAAVAPYPAMDDFYFSPLKLYEYMAAGLPVVASGAGQIAAVVEPGENGMLCAPGDAAAFTEALDRLRRDPALRGRLGRNARAAMARGHSWQAVARRILTLVEKESCLV